MNGPHLLTSIPDALTRAQRSRSIFLQITHARAARGAAVETTGPLGGVPFAVKDVFDVRGTRTSAASQVFDRRAHARRDAEAVRRVVSRGAVLIGKTTMSELAYSGIGMNDRFGTPTITREGRDYVLGGSSSGSAAAVRAGITAFALASDTSGSARIPAAWSGLFGFRPSHGRYPAAGMSPLAPTLDTAAVIAADLAGIDAVDQVLATTVDQALATMPSRRGSSDTGFVVPHDDYLVRCDPVVLSRFHADLARLRTAGHRITQRRFESLDVAWNLHQLHVPIVESEAFAAFGRYLEEPGVLSPAVRRRLEHTRVSLQERSSDVLYAAMPALRRQFADELEDDVLLSPSVAIDAPTAEAVRSDPEWHDEMNRRCLALPMLLSYLNAPSLVIPTSARTAHPPSSLQLSASAGGDRRVLDAAGDLTPA